MEESFLAWFKQHCQDYQAVLFDIDGTVTLGPKPLPNNKETIEFLRAVHYPFFFLTNDGIHPHAAKVRQLAYGGVVGYEEEIVSSSDALVAEAERRGLKGQETLLLGEPQGQEDYMKAAGLVPVDITRLDDCKAIFIGEGKFDWCNDIQKAINFLRKKPETPLLIANPDSVWTGMPDGSLGVGAGSIARFIESIMKDLGIALNMTYLGKPNPGIYLAALERLTSRFNIKVTDYRKLIMVGDALFSDICGANRLGMTSVVVMTGLTTPQILADAAGDRIPDFVFRTL